jgi:hypothetical protein
MDVLPEGDVGGVEGAPPPVWHAPTRAPAAAAPAPPPRDALAAVVERGAQAERQQTTELPKEWFRVRRPAPNAEPGPEHAARGSDLLLAVGRVRWECCALAVCALGPQFLGLLAVLVGGVMVSRSRFWEVGDKVRALLGIPFAGFTVAVLWAWLRATELQQADASKARLEIAGHSLAHSWQLAPQLVGLAIAVHLGHRLIRDARWS